MKKLANTGNKLIPVAFTLFLLVIWQGVVDLGLVQRFILPSPTDVLTAFVYTLPEMQVHIAVTLKEALTGYLIAISFSMVLAVLMDSLVIVRKALYPLLVVSQTIPIIALAPLFAVWFGFGMLPKVIVVVLVCFFPIVISLLEGLASVDTDMIRLLKSMGASKFQTFRLVKLPASMVSFFSGLRIATTYCVMGAVIAEWLGGTRGLGLYMLNVKRSYAVDKVLAATLVIIILSVLLFKIVEFLQGIAMPWNKFIYKENRRIIQ